jgi:hypothetical protein
MGKPYVRLWTGFLDQTDTSSLRIGKQGTHCHHIIVDSMWSFPDHCHRFLSLLVHHTVSCKVTHTVSFLCHSATPWVNGIVVLWTHQRSKCLSFRVGGFFHTVSTVSYPYKGLKTTRKVPTKHTSLLKDKSQTKIDGPRSPLREFASVNVCMYDNHVNQSASFRRCPCTFPHFCRCECVPWSVE